MKNKIALFLMVAFTGCSSTPQSVVDMRKIGEEEVLSSQGDKGLMDEEPFKVESGLVTALAMVSSPADGYRQEALVTMAQARCRSTVAKVIQSKLENYLQLSQQNASFDSSDMREVITEVSKITANDWRPTGKPLIQKVKVFSDSGIPHTEYRVWAKLSVDEQSFKRQILSALREQEGKSAMSQDFAKSVSNHWDAVLNAPEQKVERKAASKTEDSQTEE